MAGEKVVRTRLSLLRKIGVTCHRDLASAMFTCVVRIYLTERLVKTASNVIYVHISLRISYFTQNQSNQSMSPMQ